MKNRLLACAMSTLALCALPVHALEWKPAQLSVTAGIARHGTHSLTLAGGWPWAWKRQWLGMEFGGLTEGFVSHWRFDTPGGGDASLVQLGVLPVLRARFDAGRSAWFAEAGIGLTWTDRTYRSTDRQFSTRGNFIDMVGVGRQFGEAGQHELGIRLVHVSNAGIKKPNPGEEFVQLRYALRF